MQAAIARILDEKGQQNATLAVAPYFLLLPAPGGHSSIFCRFAYSRHFIKMDSYAVWSFMSGFLHLVFNVHPYYFIPFYGPVMFHCMDKP